MPFLSLLNSRIGRSLTAPLVRAYQNNVIKSLRKVGLRTEDLIRASEMGEVGAQSVALMPEHAQQARIRRFIRAQDIQNKHVYLSEAQQKLQQPTKQEMWPIMQHLNQRELERKTYK